jgi:hypothetical protein
MTKKRLYQRRDQIEELTRGLTLPLAPLHDFHLTSIAEMLAQAWCDLQTTQPLSLKTCDEPEITSLMEIRLNNLLGEYPSWAILVHQVARDKGTVSFDGTHLEMKPDLSIFLTNRNRNYPLVVECKLIEPSSGKTAGSYCKDGLVRFVLGEYAWAMREAFMLAYVRDGSSILSSLIPLLLRSQKGEPDPYCTEGEPESKSHPTLDLARTRHGRAFNYLGGPPGSFPGAIALWHLWVSA